MAQKQREMVAEYDLPSKYRETWEKRHAKKHAGRFRKRLDARWQDQLMEDELIWEQ